MKKRGVTKMIAMMLALVLCLTMLPFQALAQEDMELVRASETIQYTNTFNQLQNKYGTLYAVLSTKSDEFLRITSDLDGENVLDNSVITDGRLYKLEEVVSLWPSITYWRHTLRLKITVDGQTVYFWQQPGSGLTVYYYADRMDSTPALPGYARLSDTILYSFQYTRLKQQHEQLYAYLSAEADGFVRITSDQAGRKTLDSDDFAAGLYPLEGVESLWPIMTLWRHTLRLKITVDGQTVYYWRKAGDGQTVYVADAVTELPAPEDGLRPLETLQTVLYGNLLRAQTYAVAAVDETEETTPLKYFSATMYNYDTGAINRATQALEYERFGSDIERWNGLYFTYGNPTWDFQYRDDKGSVLTSYYAPPAKDDAFIEGGYFFNASEYQTWKPEHGNPYVYLPKDLNVTKDRATITLPGGHYYPLWWAESKQLQFGYEGAPVYYDSSDDNVFDDDIDGDTTNNGLKYYQNTSVAERVGAYYAAWNFGIGGFHENYNGGDWNHGDSLVRGEDDLTDGEKTLVNLFGENSTITEPDSLSVTGLVQNRLDANKNIVFNVPEVGIFNGVADETKQVYTNVGIPFKYDPTSSTYTLDSDDFTATFDNPSTDAKEAPSSNMNLFFNDTAQTLSKLPYEEEKFDTRPSWYPFNTANKQLYARQSGEDSRDYTGEGYNGELADFHFGMQITIPFTMTADGKLIQGNQDSDDLHFSFSGDDDVWIFIDGQLVGDLGGIHEKAGVEFNFAQNTLTYLSQTVQAALDEKGNATGFTENGEDALHLFNSGNVTGVLGMTRETFAASGEHELTIFYLERGATYSNIKIEFNLPMRDFVSVSKEVEVEDDIPAADMDRINNVDFNFTLFEQRDGQNEATPVANAYYGILNRNGQLIGTGVTDAKGRFQLKNGQTARFQVTIGNESVTYRAVEEVDESVFSPPTYTYDGTAANGFSKDGAGVSLTQLDKQPTGNNPTNKGYREYYSYAITVNGSLESEDSLHFHCVNHMSLTPLLTPDMIVIDYGLPVRIDVLANDVLYTENSEVTLKTTPKFGTAVVGEDNIITYTLNQQLTEVERIDYQVEINGTTYTSYVFITPATVMYYEEDFTGLIRHNGTTGKVTTEGTSANQEPGVVGTIGDSVYGSDVAYLKDGQDSNGTSLKFDVDNKTAAFTYSFTGTGTSFFTRTNANAARMRVRIWAQVTGDEVPAYALKDSGGNAIKSKNGNEVLIYEIMRDNRYDVKQNPTTFDTLYNIPVFTWQTSDVAGAPTYGTYRVEVGLVKATDTNGYGKTLYLDGVRIMNPLRPGENDADYSKMIGEYSYGIDGESGMVYETLRDKILPENAVNGNFNPLWDGKFVIFTDSDGKLVTAENYKSIGPKEEVYLYNGQSVSFFLKGYDPDLQMINLGIKAPTRSGKVNINGRELTIENATDCFYNISQYVDFKVYNGKNVAVFTITAGEGDLISLTNIKATGKLDFTIITEDTAIESGSVSVTVNGAQDVTTPWIVGLYPTAECKPSEQIAQVTAPNAEGKYVFDGVITGTYYVKVIGNTDDNTAWLYDLPDAQEVTVVAKETSEVTVNLVDAFATVQITATAEDAAQGTEVSFMVTNGSFTQTVSVPVNGNAVSVKVPAGDVTVTAQGTISGYTLENKEITFTGLTRGNTGVATFTYKKNATGGNGEVDADGIPVNSFDLVKAMGVGWNLGNTYDSPGNINSWNGGMPTEDLIDGLYKAGIRTIRVPVSWTQGKEGRMKGVKEILGWANKYKDLYIVVDSHHDRGTGEGETWGYSLGSGGNGNLEDAKKYITDTWTYIATELSGYDNRLIFETMNEPLLNHVDTDHTWNPTDECSTCCRAVNAINELNQAALDAIRSVDGNEDRFVIVVPYGAKALGASQKNFKLPDDIGTNGKTRLLLSIHEYTTYELCIAGTDTTFDDDNKAAIDKEIQKMVDLRDKLGVPIFIGETGITNASSTDNRVAWTNYYFSKVYNENTGIMACWWDNGAHGTGKENFQIIHRDSGVLLDDGKQIVAAMMNPKKQD